MIKVWTWLYRSLKGLCLICGSVQVEQEDYMGAWKACPECDIHETKETDPPLTDDQRDRNAYYYGLFYP